MGYHDSRYGVTEIREDRIDNLSINWEHDLSQRDAVLLYTVDKRDGYGDHFHIKLNQQQARILYDWLHDFLRK